MKSICSMLLLFIGVQTYAGGESSGGGTGYPAEFTELGYAAAKVVRGISTFPVSGDLFDAAVISTRIEFTNNKLKDSKGIEVDALNFPKTKLIRVNIKRWQNLILDTKQKFQLVVHEYLGILKVNDRGYKVSRIILDGGTQISSLVCKYETAEGANGLLSWYQLDINGDKTADYSKIDSVVTIDGTNLEMSAVATLAEQDEQPGFIVTWTSPIQLTAFISAENLMKTTEFNTKYFSTTHFSSGVPSYVEKGILNCSSQVK